MHEEIEFPASAKEADLRADEWEFVDPFDDLPPALLTANQILNYGKIVGLVYPFETELIKGATYEVGVGGDAYYWDENQKRRVLSVKSQGKYGITLKPNSITFVETEVEFLLPQYIAARFNLHIKLVHRGLLLGTGPIVDPGFRGRLLIPIHNLTSSPYTIEKGEKLIWVEFSKTAFGRHSDRYNYEQKEDDFRCFPKEKRRIKAQEYLWKANSNNPIMSSISGFISSTDERVETVEGRLKNIGFIGFITLLVTVVLSLGSSWSLYDSALGVVERKASDHDELADRMDALLECLKEANEAQASCVAEIGGNN